MLKHPQITLLIMVKVSKLVLELLAQKHQCCLERNKQRGTAFCLCHSPCPAFLLGRSLPSCFYLLSSVSPSSRNSLPQFPSPCLSVTLSPFCSLSLRLYLSNTPYTSFCPSSNHSIYVCFSLSLLKLSPSVLLITKSLPVEMIRYVFRTRLMFFFFLDVCLGGLLRN